MKHMVKAQKDRSSSKLGAISTALFAVLIVTTAPSIKAFADNGLDVQAAQQTAQQSAQQSAWGVNLRTNSATQEYMDKEAVAYISKGSGEIINPYKEVYDYLSEVKTHPLGDDRDAFIGVVRQSIADGKINLGEYIFIQTKYAEYQNKTWKLRLIADLAKQKKS